MHVEKSICPPLSRAVTLVPKNDPDIAIYVAVTTSRSAYIKRDWDSALTEIAMKIQSAVNGELWIVGRLLNPKMPGEKLWQLLGLFTSELNAISACTTADHFYSAAILDQLMGGDVESLPQVVFPLQRV